MQPVHDDGDLRVRACGISCAKQLAYMKGSICCLAPSDKCGANHSNAFVPDGDVKRRKRQLHSQVTWKTKRSGLHSSAGFVVFSPPPTPTRTAEDKGKKIFLERRKIPLGKKKPTRLVVAFWLLAPQKVCQDCLCCCVLRLLT